MKIDLTEEMSSARSTWHNQHAAYQGPHTSQEPISLMRKQEAGQRNLLKVKIVVISSITNNSINHDTLIKKKFQTLLDSVMFGVEIIQY